jgi:hypothetical protein
MSEAIENGVEEKKAKKAAQGGPHVVIAVNAVKKWLDKHGGITKDRDAPQQAGGYAFRGIDDLYNVLCGVTAEAGIALFPRVTASDIRVQEKGNGKYQTHVFLTVDVTIMSERDGTSVIVTVLGEGSDSSDKASNKAMSAAFKYAQIQVFQIPTHGESIDSETDHPPPVVPAKKEEPRVAPTEKPSKTEAKAAKEKAAKEEGEPEERPAKKASGKKAASKSADLDDESRANALCAVIDDAKSAKLVLDLKDEIDSLDDDAQATCQEHVVAKVSRWLDDAADVADLADLKPLIAWLNMADLKKSYMAKYQEFMG